MKSFANLFTSETNDLINDLGHNDPPKFTRTAGSTKLFFGKLTEKLATNPEMQDKYTDFINKFKL